MKNGKRAWGLMLAAVLLLGTAVLPAAAAEGTAKAVSYPARMWGPQDVELKAYQVGEKAYLRLRDVAALMGDTDLSFNVDWTGAAVTVTDGAPYTSANGTEQAAPFTGDQPYEVYRGPVIVNGQAAELDAIMLTDANGNGYTYCTRESLLDILDKPRVAIMPLIEGKEAFSWYCEKAQTALAQLDGAAALRYAQQAEEYNLDDEFPSVCQQTVALFDETDWIIQVDPDKDLTYNAKFHIDGTFEAVAFGESEPFTGSFVYSANEEGVSLTAAEAGLDGVFFVATQENGEALFRSANGCELWPDAGNGYDAVVNGGI